MILPNSWLSTEVRQARFIPFAASGRRLCNCVARPFKLADVAKKKPHFPVLEPGYADARPITTGITAS